MKDKLSVSLNGLTIFTFLVAVFVPGLVLLARSFKLQFLQKTHSNVYDVIIGLLLIFGGILFIFSIKRKRRSTAQGDNTILLKSIINSSDDGILSKTLEGIIMSWNLGAERIFGYTSSEIIGKHIAILIPADLQKEEMEIIEELKKEHAIHHYETKRIRKDGEIIDVSLTISPILDDDGRIIMASKIVRDITYGKKTEREMTRIYQENEVTLNRINDALISIDNNWRYTFLNDAALPTHVLGKEGTIGKSLWEVHPELEGTIFGKKYREAMTTMKVLEVDDYYPPMDTWFSVKMYPSADGLTIFYRNVTEQKKAEQRLLQTLKEVSDYKYALDESSIVAITDQKGIIKHANNNFCRISKYSREELIGQDHRIINSGYHSEEFIRDLWVTIANGKIWKGELKNEAKDGSIYWVDTTIIPFLNENDKPYQYVAIRSDITERKKTEENLEKSELRLKEIINDLLQKNKNHEQFAQIVSHNLRAPVANIIGFSNVLQRSGLDDIMKMKFIQGLFSASNRLDTVIKDLTHILQVSREISENKQTVCLSDMVHDVRASISNMVEKEKAEIHYEFTTDEINTIKTYLYSIFYNLISNSIKFRRPSVNPVIEIKGYKKGDFFQISFRDNGLGIDIHNKPDEIFGFYKRFHDHIEGKGLGLFMTKTQVESMGGSITVNSKLNEGTEFVIALPA